MPKADNVDSKHFAWHNKDMPYRLKIVMPARAQVPIFHYISGYQQAQLVKQNMKQMLQSEEEVAKIKDLIKLVCILFKIVVFLEGLRVKLGDLRGGALREKRSVGKGGRRPCA